MNCYFYSFIKNNDYNIIICNRRFDKGDSYNLYFENRWVKEIRSRKIDGNWVDSEILEIDLKIPQYRALLNGVEVRFGITNHLHIPENFMDDTWRNLKIGDPLGGFEITNEPVIWPQNKTLEELPKFFRSCYRAI